jgi:hypothetical protein
MRVCCPKDISTRCTLLVAAGTDAAGAPLSILAMTPFMVNGVTWIIVRRPVSHDIASG